MNANKDVRIVAMFFGIYLIMSGLYIFWNSYSFIPFLLNYTLNLSILDIFLQGSVLLGLNAFIGSNLLGITLTHFINLISLLYMRTVRK